MSTRETATPSDQVLPHAFPDPAIDPSHQTGARSRDLVSRLTTRAWPVVREEAVVSLHPGIMVSGCRYESFPPVLLPC